MADERTPGDLGKLMALQARVRALEENLEGVQDIRATVQELAGGLEELASRQRQAKPAPAWWPTMAGDEHAERWPAFIAWVRDVLAVRYPRETGRAVTPCWADHPAAVDALTAAWLTWQASYLNRGAEPRDAATWQAVTLPEMLERVGKEVSGCRDGCRGPGDPADVGFRG